MPKGRGSFVGITISDLNETRDLFQANGWPLPQRFFHYSPADDQWELWRVQPSGTKTLISVCYDGTKNDWSAV